VCTEKTTEDYVSSENKLKIYLLYKNGEVVNEK